jgi:hypothetical protein
LSVDNSSPASPPPPIPAPPLAAPPNASIATGFRRDGIVGTHAAPDFAQFAGYFSMGMLLRDGMVWGGILMVRWEGEDQRAG